MLYHLIFINYKNMDIITEFIGTKEDIFTATDGVFDIDHPSDIFNRYCLLLQEITPLHKERVCIGSNGTLDGLKVSYDGICVGYSKITIDILYYTTSLKTIHRCAKYQIQDFCLVHGFNLIPLDKPKNDTLNICISEFNKRKQIKRGIPYIHNQIQTLCYSHCQQIEDEDIQKNLQDYTPKDIVKLTNLFNIL